METDGKKSTSEITVSLGEFVYDVTDFAARHPGGRNVLEKYNGRDVTEAMQNTGTHVHSLAAYGILENYRVGGGHVTSGGVQRGELRKGSLRDDARSPDDFDGYVDWSKPLMEQVGRLGDDYYAWTHQPVSRPIRLFQSELAEMFSRAYWWMVPLVWVPVVANMAVSSWACLAYKPELWPASEGTLAWRHGPSSVPWLLASGVMLWTFLEYVIHRWMFHLKPPGWSPLLIRLHFALHGQHHKSPMDPMRLVFPPLPALTFALLFYTLCGLVFPPGMARAVFAGILAGYLLYDLTHYYIHHGGTPPLTYFRQLKTYHNLHHYRHQQLGFGISSKLWDFPFSTLIPQDNKAKKVQ